MNIKRAKQEIIHTIQAYLEKDACGEYRIPSIRQRPVLLMGPPGIGKTQIMEQIAGECDLALVAYTITHHTRQSAIGLPFIVQKNYGGEERSVTEYTMSEIIASVYDRMEASGKREGILFIDEINCVSETLAPAMLQFLQGKTFGNQPVPKGWIIVAAGNPPEYNRSVRDFDVVTLDRVKVINVEPDFSVWKEYAYQAGIHQSIISYLDLRKDRFYRMETTVDGKRFVTARGWEDLSEMIYAAERLGIEIDREVTGQYLQHPATAKDFANYLDLFRRYRSDYQIDEILSGTIRPGILNRLKFAPFDERTEVVGLVLSGLFDAFRNAYDTDRNTDALYAILKEYRAAETAFRTAGGENVPAEEAQTGATQTAAGGTGAPVQDAQTGTAKTADGGEGQAADGAQAGTAKTADGGEGQAADGAQAGTAKTADGAAGQAADISAAEPAAASPAQRLALLREQKAEELENRIRAGQNEKDLRRESRRLLGILQEWGNMIAGCTGDGEKAWDLLREAFRETAAGRAQTMDDALARLEYAFDFMETAFGESQEMVLFITELSVNRYAAWFLQEKECSRYYMYNKKLLFDEQDAQIRGTLDEIRDLQIT